MPTPMGQTPGKGNPLEDALIRFKGLPLRLDRNLRLPVLLWDSKYRLYL